MVFPSLKDEAPPQAGEPLEQVSRLILQASPSSGVEEPIRRERRLVGALAVSGALHAATLLLLLLAFTQLAPIVPPEEGLVPLTFVKPEPLLAPAPAPRPPSAALPQPRRSLPPAAPPEPEPHEKLPMVPPVGPLPEPNRMGDQVPVPPPPKPNQGPVPPDSSRPERQAAGELRQEADTPPPLGTPDGAGKEPPQGEPGRGSDASAATLEGEKRGSLSVPDRLHSGIGGVGSRIPGPASKAPRRGLNYGVPFDTGAFGNFTFEHPDFDWTDYWSVMYWAIWRAWHNKLLQGGPAFERASLQRGTPGLSGTAVIQFTIERNGNISRIDVVTPSGVQELDQASGDALREVILPPLPSNFPYERERVTGTFIMDIPDVREWLPGMAYLKSRGVF